MRIIPSLFSLDDGSERYGFESWEKYMGEAAAGQRIVENHAGEVLSERL
ncbi:MAG: hypothetical protein AB7P24_04505 [Nitrospira sp.]